eukprot:SAG31_NODE_14654_length_794_cov_1.328058_2_plen_49_part_01
MIVGDCLQLMLNLLRQNVSNQVYYPSKLLLVLILNIRMSYCYFLMFRTT